MISGIALNDFPEGSYHPIRQLVFDGGAPAALREIGEFLLEMARTIEAGEMRTTHLHIGDLNPTWDKRHPESDIVVQLPVNWDEVFNEVERKSRGSSGRPAFPLHVNWKPDQSTTES